MHSEPGNQNKGNFKKNLTLQTAVPSEVTDIRRKKFIFIT
jgi:hypothetical protein